MKVLLELLIEVCNKIFFNVKYFLFSSKENKYLNNTKSQSEISFKLK